MAGEQYRVSISTVFWTADPADATGVIESINNALPEADRSGTLSAIEYIEGGKPEPPTAPAPEEQVAFPEPTASESA